MTTVADVFESISPLPEESKEILFVPTDYHNNPPLWYTENDFFEDEIRDYSRVFIFNEDTSSWIRASEAPEDLRRHFDHLKLRATLRGIPANGLIEDFINELPGVAIRKYREHQISAVISL